MISRKFPILIVALSVIFAMCKNSDSLKPRGGEKLSFEHVKYAPDTLTEVRAQMSIEVDYPTEVTMLGKNIREWIEDELFISSQSVLDSITSEPATYKMGANSGEVAEGEKVVEFYAKQIIDNLKTLDLNNEIPSEVNVSIYPIYETEKLVTYKVDKYIYFGGGAHGVSPIYCVTFRKSDGKMFNEGILVNFPQQLIKKELANYFGQDEQSLEEILFSPSVDLPKKGVYFSEDGLEFLYQQYELAPYAYGLPDFVIPYSEAKKYMTPSALTLIDLEK